MKNYLLAFILATSMTPVHAISPELYELGRAGYEKTVAKARELELQADIPEEIILKWCTTEGTCALTTLFELRKINKEHEEGLTKLECWIDNTYSWPDDCEQ